MSQYNRYFAQSLSYYGCIFPKSFDKGNTFADAVRHFHHHGQPDTLKHHRITAACAPYDPGDRYIQAHYSRYVVVAIDASVGSPDHVGYATLGRGALQPGPGYIGYKAPDSWHVPAYPEFRSQRLPLNAAFSACVQPKAPGCPL